MMLFSRISHILHFLLVFYIVIAVVYTTNSFVVLPLCANLAVLVHYSPLPTSVWKTIKRNAVKQDARVQDAQTYQDIYFQKQPSRSKTEWRSSTVALEHGLGDSEPILVDEDLSLSKAFSSSMRPSRIIPYFYRASGKFHQEDLTITTLVTSSRFHAFSQLVERYQGPISVTIHVGNTTAEIQAILKYLRSLYASSSSMATYVDVHLVVDSFDRQFNTWRNIARLFARTDYIMMLDVDFYICTDFRAAIRKSPHIMSKLREGNTAFVIPAFEYTKYVDGLDPSKFPKDKRTLLGLVKSKHIGMFHASWAPGHNSTDYKKYYAAPPGHVYRVTQYSSAYEPYVIFKKEGPPWCDDRFVGYGGNKAACLFEMYISGVSYYVLADHFIVHQSHRYEETARRHERRYNRKLYAEFVEEICLRYLGLYQDMGLLNTTRGSNASQECKGNKRIARLATEAPPSSVQTDSLPGA